MFCIIWQQILVQRMPVVVSIGLKIETLNPLTPYKTFVFASSLLINVQNWIWSMKFFEMFLNLQCISRVTLLLQSVMILLSFLWGLSKVMCITVRLGNYHVVIMPNKAMMVVLPCIKLDNTTWPKVCWHLPVTPICACWTWYHSRFILPFLL